MWWGVWWGWWSRVVVSARQRDRGAACGGHAPSRGATRPRMHRPRGHRRAAAGVVAEVRQLMIAPGRWRPRTHRGRSCAAAHSGAWGHPCAVCAHVFVCWGQEIRGDRRPRQRSAAQPAPGSDASHPSSDLPLPRCGRTLRAPAARCRHSRAALRNCSPPKPASRARVTPHPSQPAQRLPTHRPSPPQPVSPAPVQPQDPVRDEHLRAGPALHWQAVQQRKAAAAGQLVADGRQQRAKCGQAQRVQGHG